MSRDFKMIKAGSVAGAFSCVLGWAFGEFHGRGAILGMFLAIGIIAIEKMSKDELSQGRCPKIIKVIAVALLTGILSGLLGYHTVFVHNEHADINFYYPYSFSYFQYTLLITLYPLFIFPAFFTKQRLIATVVAGSSVSFVIEMIRLSNSMKNTDIIVVFKNVLYLLPFMGFSFSLLWVVLVSNAAGKNRIQG